MTPSASPAGSNSGRSDPDGPSADAAHPAAHWEEPPPPPEIPELLRTPVARPTSAITPKGNVALEQLGKVAVIGTNFAASVAGMGLVGWLLDRWLKTAPVLLLVGLALGLIAGGYSFVREAKRATKGGSGKR